MSILLLLSNLFSLPKLKVLMVKGDFKRANSIDPSSGLINQHGSSSNCISFNDRGLQRTMTCTFSRIDVDFVEKEGFKLGLLLGPEFDEDDVGLGYTLSSGDSFQSGVGGGLNGLSVDIIYKKKGKKKGKRVSPNFLKVSFHYLYPEKSQSTFQIKKECKTLMLEYQLNQTRSILFILLLR